ncbi:MAG TPA: response regulator transcription factor [Gemmataceae bacterium]|jgi:sigma-B regulation protein RsbU (phosphoserine phosphatase)|nr:response regulator transcription factor [Gemmataceae bacterium]
MKVLIADDDRVTCRMLEAIVSEWGAQPRVARDGTSAWEILQEKDAPKLAILDWLMPGIDGLEVCRRIRALPAGQQTYVILLTVKGNRADIVEGLRSGADDYLAKPFDPEELQARLQTGKRIITLQHGLASKVEELEGALARVEQLQGLLPICSYCKRIRDDQNYWQQVEGYITTHSNARFTHSVCPACFDSMIQPELKKLESLVQSNS